MRLIACLLLNLLFTQSIAFDRVSVLPDSKMIEMPGKTYRFSDSTKSLSINQVLSISRDLWDKQILSGFTQDVEWVLLPFTNNSSVSFDKVLYLNNLFIHEADFFFVIDGKLQKKHVATGLSRPSDTKLYSDPMYPIEVHFPANSKVDVYMRVYDPMSTNNSPLFLMSFEEALRLKDIRMSISFLWIGILALALTLSLFLFVSIRQRIFLDYLFLGIATFMICTANAGTLLIFIDSDPYQFSTNYYQFGAVLLINFMPRFLNGVVPISQISPLAWKGVKILGYAGLAIAILYTIPYFKFNFYFTSLTIDTLVNLSTVVFLYLLVVLFIAALKRMQRAITLFIVYLIYLGVAFGVILFPFLGAANDGLNTFYFMLAGSIFETVAFMLLMAQVTLSIYKEREELNRQVQSNQEVMMNAIVKGQEDERKRFAEDLHDGFGQMISSLNLNLKSLETIKSTNTEKRIGIFQASKSVLDDMYVELKNICFNLMPQTLIAAGVGEALKEFAVRLNQSQKIAVQVSFYDLDHRLTQVQEISLYRISQEWINNIVKYSDATKIGLQITKDTNEITLLIEDNGAGFDKNKLKKGKGNGWKNISSRANLIKGEVELDTTVGLQGTTFILNAPTSIESKAEQKSSNLI